MHPTAAEVQTWFDQEWTSATYEASVAALHHFIDCMNAHAPGVGFSLSHAHVAYNVPLYNGQSFHVNHPYESHNTRLPAEVGVLHEVCHFLAAPHCRRQLPNFGLDSTFDDSGFESTIHRRNQISEEHRVCILNVMLAAAFGLNWRGTKEELNAHGLNFKAYGHNFFVWTKCNSAGDEQLTRADALASIYFWRKNPWVLPVIRALREKYLGVPQPTWSRTC